MGFGLPSPEGRLKRAQQLSAFHTQDRKNPAKDGPRIRRADKLPTLPMPKLPGFELIEEIGRGT